VYQIRKVGVLFVLEMQIIVPDAFVEFQNAVLFKGNMPISQTVESDAHTPDVSRATADLTMLCDTEFRRHERG
jgi:hypothetical protein